MANFTPLQGYYNILKNKITRAKKKIDNTYLIM